MATVGADTTDLVDEGLAPATTYRYRVVAVDAFGRSSDPSAVATATTDPIPAPTGLSASAVSTSEINLSWVDHSDGEDGLVIEMRAADAPEFGVVATTAPNARHYTAVGLAQDTRYYFRVSATRAGVRSTPAGPASAETRAVPEPDAPDEPNNPGDPNDPNHPPTDTPPGPEDGPWETVGSATTGVYDGSVSPYGTFDAGYYRIRYVGGAINYTYGQYWGTEGTAVSNGAAVANPNGPYYYDTAAEAAAAALDVGLKESFGHGGGTIGLRLDDNPYYDNDGGGCTFVLERSLWEPPDDNDPAPGPHPRPGPGPYPGPRPGPGRRSRPADPDRNGRRDPLVGQRARPGRGRGPGRVHLHPLGHAGGLEQQSCCQVHCGRHRNTSRCGLPAPRLCGDRACWDWCLRVRPRLFGHDSRR